MEESMKTALVWLLLTQGTGSSGSAITVLHSYPTEAACKADGEKLKKVFYAHYMCLDVSPDGAVR
jgi:hypothetical protein